jgi:uncharacterized protein YbjT (DUF2867 family)
MYLVTGATGHVGDAVARQLHEQGHGVRAPVRDPSRAATLPAGIELAAGDLDDPDGVSKAVAGVEAIFLMQVGIGTGQTKTMIAAARDAAVPRIVLLSSAGARLLPLDDNSFPHPGPSGGGWLLSPSSIRNQPVSCIGR